MRYVVKGGIATTCTLCHAVRSVKTHTALIQKMKQFLPFFFKNIFKKGGLTLVGLPVRSTHAAVPLYHILAQPEVASVLLDGVHIDVIEANAALTCAAVIAGSA